MIRSAALGLLLLAAVPTVSTRAGAQADDARERLTLVGLRRFAVFVGYVGDESALAAAPARDAIRSVIETKLEGAGIGIAPRSEYLSRDAVPAIYVTLHCARPEAAGGGPARAFAYHIDVGVDQFVSLLSGATAKTTTWRRGTLYVTARTDRDVLRDEIERRIRVQLDEFVRAWSAVNPRGRADGGGGARLVPHRRRR